MKRIILAAFTILLTITTNAQSVTVYPANSPSACNGYVYFNDSLTFQTWVWTDENTIPITPTTDNTGYGSLCPGTYAIIVTDMLNVVDTIYFTIPDCSLDPIAATINIDAYPINGNCIGELAANVSGGNLPYTYKWNFNQALNMATVSNLCSGTHNLIVTDNIGCTMQESIALANLTSQNADLSITNITSNGNCDGSVLLENSLNFTSWGWTNSSYGVIQSMGTNINNLCAGTYYIITTDVLNVVDTLQFTIVDNCANLNLETTTFWDLYSTCVGSSWVIASGGEYPYTFSWSNSLIANNQVNPYSSVHDLCVGDYTVTLTDGNNCEVVEIVTIGDSSAFQNIYVTSSSINSSTNTQCDGSAVLSVYGSNPPYTFNNTTVLNDEITLNNLCSGYQTAVIYDSTGDSLVYSFYIGYDNTDPCTNMTLVTNSFWDYNNACIGTINALPSGGTTPYSYTWSNGLIGNTSNTGSYVLDICVGNYTVTATDANGCILTENAYVGDSTFALQNFEASMYIIDASADTTCNGSVSVLISGGLAPYQVNNGLVGSTFTIDSLCPGFYTTVIYDSSGDSTTISYLITSLSTTIINTPYVDSTNVDTLLNDLLQNCTINYQNVDSAYVTSVSFITADSAAINFTIYYNGQATVITEYYNFNSGSGVYTVVLNLFCPNKSTHNFLKIYDQIYYDQNLVGTSWSLGMSGELENFKVNIYPIPFTTSLNIDLSKTDTYQITVFDMSGKQIFTKSVNHSNFVTLNLEGLSKGQYVIRIQNENTFITRKIVK